MQSQVLVDRFLRNEVSKQYNLNAYQKLILFYLASYSGSKTECFPAIQTLANDCNISNTSVTRNIKLLEQKNLLKVSRSRGMSNHYTLTLPGTKNTPVSQLVVSDSYDYPHPIDRGPLARSNTNNISNNIKECTSLFSSNKTRANKKISLPSNMNINKDHQNLANTLSLNVEKEFLNFKEHNLAKGSRFVNWDLAFNTWLRTAAKFVKEKKSSNVPRDVMAGVYHE